MGVSDDITFWSTGDLLRHVTPLRELRIELSRMEDGGWRMEGGGWRMEDREWRVESDHPPL
jgi:hypothetical protein